MSLVMLRRPCNILTDPIVIPLSGDPAMLIIEAVDRLEFQVVPSENLNSRISIDQSPKDRLSDDVLEPLDQARAGLQVCSGRPRRDTM